MSMPQLVLLRRRPAHTHAFTLIELLTVIAIIGILAAILIPVVGKVRSAANKSACIAGVRQVGSAVLLYTGDNKNTLPGPIFSGVRPRYLTTDAQTLGYNIARYLSVPLPVGNTITLPSLLCPTSFKNGVSSDDNYWTLASVAPDPSKPNITFQPFGYPSPRVEPSRLTRITAPSTTQMLYENLQGGVAVHSSDTKRVVLYYDGHVNMAVKFP
jgi:prepilin-type N-terminal cleavage/methylation domain-containing protein